MTRPPTRSGVRDRIRSIVADDDRLLFVYVFGSVARGTDSDSSDVDIAVYPSRPISLLDEVDLGGRLGQALGCEVDLVMLDRAPLWLQYRVLGDGQVVHSRDEAARVAFRARVEKAFLDFRPLHDAYLAAVRRRARRGALSGG